MKFDFNKIVIISGLLGLTALSALAAFHDTWRVTVQSDDYGWALLRLPTNRPIRLVKKLSMPIANTARVGESRIAESGSIGAAGQFSNWPDQGLTHGENSGIANDSMETGITPGTSGTTETGTATTRLPGRPNRHGFA